MKDELGEDKGLGKVIASRLREQLQAAATGCPDADTLAAYYDRALTERERETCEAHIMICLRCQDQIAELVRLSDADQPQVLLAETPAEEEKPAPGWNLNLAWVGLALVIAVSVGVWRRGEISRLLQPRHQITENVPPPPSAQEAPDEAAKEVATTSQRDKAEGAKPKETAQAVPPGSAEARKIASAKPLRAAGGSRGGVVTSRAGRELGAIAAPSQPTGASATVQPGGHQIELRAEKPNMQLTDRAAPAPSATLGFPSGHAKTAKPSVPTEQAIDALGAPNISVRGLAPEYKPKWRVGRRGLLQKADPDGNWLTVPSGVDSDLFDITFAGPSAGWAVGHEGLVLRTTDGGNTWSRASSPIGEDLVHVSATSGLEAHVMTRKNRVFSTTDGGQSWTALPQP